MGTQAMNTRTVGTTQAWGHGGMLSIWAVEKFYARMGPFTSVRSVSRSVALISPRAPRLRRIPRGDGSGIVLETAAYLAGDASLDVGELEVRPWTELAAWVDACAPRRAGRTVSGVEHGEAAR